MTIREVTMYQAVCDVPDCGSNTEDLGDYSAYIDASSATEEAFASGWWDGGNGQHYCDQHPTQWESDDSNSWPDPPFVLIHDPGDGAEWIGDDTALAAYFDRKAY